MELLALAYRWPPSEAERMDIDEFVRWSKRADEALKARAGT
ncbi:GpE family phage tail protein [Caldimonas manganoxidans]|nr:GpE family phage tail protein [Caldimonas manganoxidans]